MAKPSLKSLPYASHITNLLHIKNISTGNWEMITPTVTPINMSAVNKMLVAGSVETLRVILYHDPPPSNLEYTANVVAKFLKAKEQLVEFGKAVDHIPEYKVSTKRQSRKPSTSSLPPRQSSPPASPPHSSAPPPPRRETREDRVLDAIAQLSLNQQKFAEYNYNCLTQIHQEHEFLSKKIEDSYHSLEAAYSFSSIPPPPPPQYGFPFIWPPSGYYTVFPSRRPEDIPGSSGAGPSEAATAGGDASTSGVASGAVVPDAGGAGDAGGDTAAGDEMVQ